MSREDALCELRELLPDPEYGPAAHTALLCVVDHDADPRMLLAVIRASMEGHEWLPKAERERRRYAQTDTPHT